tara:strand:- start:294 stop:842 length:549 start_codon:yes stop_codon:yes gene_type:complete
MSQRDSGNTNPDSNTRHHHHHHHHHDDDSFGDFQANVGRVGAKASVVGAWIFAIIMGIIGIAMAVFAFIPRYKDEGCTDELTDAEKSLDNCNDAIKSPPGLSDQPAVTNTCDDEKEQVESLKKSCKKTRNYLLLLGLLLIPVGVLIVWGAKAWDRKVQSSRSAAQFGGALTEASIVSDMLRR